MDRQQDHDAIHSQIDRQHAALEPTIVSRGGKVLAHYHDAMNGMKVEIERGEIAGLRPCPESCRSSLYPSTASECRQRAVHRCPAVWQGIPGFRGEHVKIAIIDTGIDYTHANFGGPGTVAAFAAAAATSAAQRIRPCSGPTRRR